MSEDIKVGDWVECVDFSGWNEELLPRSGWPRQVQAIEYKGLSFGRSGFLSPKRFRKVPAPDRNLELLESCRAQSEAHLTARLQAEREVEQLRREVDRLELEAKVDGPVFNLGRSEGQSDVGVMVRKIVDPEDKNRLNLDGILSAVRRFTQERDELRRERDELLADADRLAVELVEVAWSRDDMEARMDALDWDRTSLVAQLGVVARERNEARTERAEAVRRFARELDDFEERPIPVADMDAACVELVKLAGELDEVRADLAETVKERDYCKLSRTDMLAQLGRVTLERDEATRERDEACAELAASSSALRPDSVREWCDRAHALAKEKGWWPEDRSPVDRIPEALALIHSEVSEALEAYRVDGSLRMRVAGKIHALNPLTGTAPTLSKPEGFVVELADVLLRVFDLCGALGLDLERALGRKHEFNATRPHRHGGKRA